MYRSRAIGVVAIVRVPLDIKGKLLCAWFSGEVVSAAQHDFTETTTFEEAMAVKSNNTFESKTHAFECENPHAGRQFIVRIIYSPTGQTIVELVDQRADSVVHSWTHDNMETKGITLANVVRLASSYLAPLQKAKRRMEIKSNFQELKSGSLRNGKIFREQECHRDFTFV